MLDVEGRGNRDRHAAHRSAALSWRSWGEISGNPSVAIHSRAMDERLTINPNGGNGFLGFVEHTFCAVGGYEASEGKPELDGEGDDFRFFPRA